MVKLIESPRDAMQGIKNFIPTRQKVAFINSLLKVGFDILDFGSFVSPKAIPQLKDTAEVLEQLDLSSTNTKLLVIIANKKGGEIASRYTRISYLGFPYSVSEKFLQLNINSNKIQSLERINELLEISNKHDKKLMVYISMAFGNPYDEPWYPEMLAECTKGLSRLGVKNISLSDIIGVATPDSIRSVFSMLIPEFNDIEFGFHLHTTAQKWYANIDAAFNCGCRSFDCVINGLGGCPMSGYELLGNIPTMNLINYFDEKKIPLRIDRTALAQARIQADLTFNSF